MASYNSYDPITPEPKPSSDRTRWLLLGGCLTLLMCIGCAVVAGAVGYYFYNSDESPPTRTAAGLPTRSAATRDVPPLATTTAVPKDNATAVPTPQLITPTAVAPTLALPVPDDIVTDPIPPRAVADLETLYLANYPVNDYYETAVRLGQFDLGERTIFGAKYSVGDARRFFNGDNAIDATLVAATEHVYFWVEDDLRLEQTAVQAAADRFENDYYAALISLFGDVWTPGVDNDPRFSVLHATEGTDGELGRFSSIDEFPKSLYDDSNEQEMIYLNMGELRLGSDLYYGTLVHEVQHLIQWYVDPSEALWVNEGLSQLAEIYMGLETADTRDYLLEPHTQLNAWEFDEPEVYAHYAASYLFFTYLWEQLGDDAVRELARHPANGMAGVRAILEGYVPGVTISEFVGDWAAAVYLDDTAAGPLYTYRSLDFRRPNFEVEVSEAPYAGVNLIAPFGVHYIDLNDLRGATTIRFAGDTVTPLIGSPPTSGEQMWLAPAIDETNAQLTAAFDLNDLDSATLKYNVWFDLEEDYDYAYLSVSTDGGESWELLYPDGATAGEYGPGYNGRSEDLPAARGGWIKESVSLDAYVPNTVLVRFDVVTDSDITARGFAIDDIAVPEWGNYQTDLEENNGGWVADGFVLTGWQLPQQWSIKLIEDGPEPVVTTLTLDDLNQGEWQIDIGKGGAVLAIIPTTPFVDATAAYWLSVEQ